MWSPHNYYQDLTSAFLRVMTSVDLAFEEVTHVPLGAALPEISPIASFARFGASMIVLDSAIDPTETRHSIERFLGRNYKTLP